MVTKGSQKVNGKNGSATRSKKTSGRASGKAASKRKSSDDASFSQWIVKSVSSFSRFEGNMVFLIFVLLFGVLFPPAMSFGIMYLIYRTFPKEPRIFDRHIWIFTVSMFIVSLINLSFTVLGDQEVVRMAFYSTMFTLLLAYPFVFAWLWFDWNYGLNANRKQ